MNAAEATIGAHPPDTWDLKPPKEGAGAPFGAQFSERLEDAEWKLICALSNSTSCSDDSGGEDEDEIEIDPDP